jgi:hypothetical protein
MVDFTRPPHASHHCRHYSFNVPITRSDSGPQCARGCSFDEPGSTGRCMPEPKGDCSERQEYTDAERQAWKAATAASMERLGRALQALPHPIPLRTSGEIDCPNCDGKLQYARWHRGAEIKCTTPFCCGAHFSIAAGADWPVSKAKVS